MQKSTESSVRTNDRPDPPKTWGEGGQRIQGSTLEGKPGEGRGELTKKKTERMKRGGKIAGTKGNGKKGR